MRKIFQFPVFVLLAALAVSSTGCSVKMAASGKLKPKPDEITIGDQRQKVLSFLGSPVKTYFKESNQVDVFYISKNYPILRYTRAFVYSVLDVGTFGLWELIGTPLEQYIQYHNKISVEYDKNGAVISVLDLGDD